MGGYLVFLPRSGSRGGSCGRHGGVLSCILRPQRTKVNVPTSLTSVLRPLDVPTPLHPAPGRVMSLSLQV